MDLIFQFYENELGAKDFYSILKQKSIQTPNLFNPHIVYSYNKSNEKVLDSESLEVCIGDFRIDMPISLGNPESNDRFLILGLEPRHTNNIYNIMRSGRNVFATPFGIDKWFSESKQNIYASAFEKFLNLDRLFLFSDFVKEYKVFDPNQKSLNDKNARVNFEINFSSKYKKILEEEIELFQPTIIIALGKTIIPKKVPKSWLDKYDVKIISHPTNGNFNRMQREMDDLLNKNI